MEIILVFIGIIIAIVSGWYTYRSYQHGREIASKGAELKIGLYSIESPKDLYILLPFNESKLFFFPFIFSLTNLGKISAKNVEVFITVSSGLAPTDAEKQVSKIGIARGIKYASEEGRTKHLTDSYINIGEISPKTTIRLSDEFSWQSETIIRMPVEATSKDGVNFTVKVIATFSLILEVKIAYQDSNPIIKYYSINFRKLGEDEKLEEFLKREQKLQRNLDEMASATNEYDTKSRRVRIVTFGKYEQFEEVTMPKQNTNKNERMRMQFIRCDQNSVRYVDCITTNDKFISG